MTGPFVAVSTAPAGTPVRVTATVGERRWWARVRQFQRSAYVEVWNDAGFDVEAVVPTDDVATTMAAALGGRTGALPVASADALFRAALTFAAAGGVDGAAPMVTPRHVSLDRVTPGRSLLSVVRPV